MSAARVGAVVVNYHAAEHAIRCVASLRAAGVADVVVVDNDSHDGLEALLAPIDPGVRFIQSGANLGYGRAANLGSRALDNELLLVSNPDVVVEPGAVKALVDALDREPDVGVVGPRIDNTDGSLYPSARAFPSTVDAVGHAILGFVAPRNRFTARYRRLGADYELAHDPDWISGSFFLVRRKVFDAVGGFDESYFMYMEDVDLCWRIRNRGWRIRFEPAARVVHVQGASTDRRPYRMIAEHHRSLLRFTWRSTPGWRRALVPLMALGMAARVPVAWGFRAFTRRSGA